MFCSVITVWCPCLYLKVQKPTRIVMNFLHFVQKTEEAIGRFTPNFEAQQKMAPFKVGDRNKMLMTNPNPRKGGVMILIFNRNEEAHIALIRRPEYDGVHSGQIAFPGGSHDEEDANMQETALRELHEEVGIAKEQVTVIGEISNVYIPPSKFLVYPFVGVLKGDAVFEKDDFEVAEVIEVPISLLFDDAIIKNGNVKVGNGNFTIKAPYFDVFGHKVWGATAIMLSEFKAILKK